MNDPFDVVAAYRRGSVRFMDLDLIVEPGSLVPREETELLARAAIEALRQSSSAPPLAIDLCCGSGNLACAIARHVPHAKVWASDVADACVDLAARNADACGVRDRVAVYQGDLFSPFEGLDLANTIDLVVCNPPYISDRKLATDRAELVEHEPRLAFAAGPYGLDVHMRVVREAHRFLRGGGILAVEVGPGQAAAVARLVQRAGAYEAINVLPQVENGRVVLACKRSA